LLTENTPGTDGSPAALGPQPDLVRLKQGDTVGSRFVVDERLRDDVIGPVYRAVDEKSGRKIVIVMLDGTLGIDKASTEDMRAAIKVATSLAHKNLVSVFGLGRENKRRYVAREYVDGQTLSELLEKKAEAGKSFTLKGAYNLIAHVCNALQFALPHLSHGTLRPGNVLINRTGRVKVADFGFGGLRNALTDRRDSLNRWDAMCFPRASGGGSSAASPAVADDGPDADVSIEGALDGLEAAPHAPAAGVGGLQRHAADDLQALGAMLYALLVGRPFTPESTALPPDITKRLPEGLERVLQRCWGGEGVARFRDPNELKTELLHIIEANRGSDREGDADGLPAESSIVALDDQVSGVGTPITTAPPLGAPGKAAPRAPGKAAPRAAKRPAPPKDDGGFVIPELRPAGVVEDDGTTQRWLVEKGGVDYGPFTSKQIIEKLFAEEIVSETNLYDIETDRRLPLSEHAVFDDALVSWIHEKAEREKRRAEEAREAAERRRTRMFMSVGLAVLLLVGGVGGGFAWYQSTLPKPEKSHLATLVTRWQASLPQILLPDEAPETQAEVADKQKARQTDAAQKRARDEARKMADEERLAAASELDGTSGGGTGRTFDQSAMNAMVAERNPQIIKCLQDEIRRDPSRRNFEVKATILPRGDVINVRMEGGTAAGSSCVRAALGNLKVPAFDGTNQTLRLPFNIN
jgi:serine/threonine protein kinase